MISKQLKHIKKVINFETGKPVFWLNCFLSFITNLIENFFVKKFFISWLVLSFLCPGRMGTILIRLLSTAADVI